MRSAGDAVRSNRERRRERKVRQVRFDVPNVMYGVRLGATRRTRHQTSTRYAEIHVTNADKRK